MAALIRNVSGYETSRDYAALVEIMRQQSVICIVDYGRGDGSTPCRDVAHTIFENGVKSNRLTVSGRGISYAYAYDVPDFIKQCREANLEFIPPSVQGKPSA